jgi:uncharacterized membrane protein
MIHAFYEFLLKLGYVHPVHPTQVNMPIGLVVGALLLSLVAIIGRRPAPARCARFCLGAALFFLIFAAATGFMDWQRFYGGVLLPAIKIKIGLAIFLFLLLTIALVATRRAEPETRPPLLISFLGFITVVVLGFFGANLVFGGRTPPGPPEFVVGRELFRSHCSGCHPHGGNLLHPDDVLYGSGRLYSFEKFLSWIREPKAPMPAFDEHHFPEEKARELYGYLDEVFTLKL